MGRLAVDGAPRTLRTSTTATWKAGDRLIVRTRGRAHWHLIPTNSIQLLDQYALDDQIYFVGMPFYGGTEEQAFRASSQWETSVRGSPCHASPRQEGPMGAQKRGNERSRDDKAPHRRTLKRCSRPLQPSPVARRPGRPREAGALSTRRARCTRRGEKFSRWRAVCPPGGRGHRPARCGSPRAPPLRPTHRAAPSGHRATRDGASAPI